MTVEENDVNEDIPPQIEQVLNGAQGDKVPIMGGSNGVLVVPPEFTKRENIEVLLTLAQGLNTNVNMGI